MPAGEGLQSPLKAQPFYGLAASTGARCGPTAASRSELRSICSETLQGVTLAPVAQTQPWDTAPGQSPGLRGIVTERGRSEQN